MSDDVKHVVHHQAPECTNYPNLFHADRLSPDIGGWIELKKARGVWTFNVVGIGGPITTITGFIEMTHDKTNPITVVSFTAATTMPMNVQNIAAKYIRARVTAFTAGTGCIGYRIGASFTQT